MALNRATGNMFGFVSHTHSAVGGECPHKCTYCYVGKIRWGRPKKYVGPLRIVPEELKVRYGEGKMIFCENCNDLFAAEIPDEMIRQVLEHCCLYPKNTYLFHSKNPARYADYLHLMPPNCVLGATVETNRPTPGISQAPAPMERLAAMRAIPGRKLVTVEPILDFDLPALATGLLLAKPEMVIVGADSKCCGLQEPGRNQILDLLDVLRAGGLEVRQKPNLARLLR